MKKLRLKRSASFLLCLLMVFSFVAPVYADVGIEVHREIYEGVVYEVVITYDEHGNKVVTTSSSDGYVATVVNDGVYLHLTELNIFTGEVWEHSIRLEPYEPIFTPEPNFSKYDEIQDESGNNLLILP